METERRVFVFRNDAHWEEGKVIEIKSKTTIRRFKQQCTKILGLKKAKVVYLKGGAVVEEIDELQNGDSLYLSQGEPYFDDVRCVRRFVICNFCFCFCFLFLFHFKYFFSFLFFSYLISFFIISHIHLYVTLPK